MKKDSSFLLSLAMALPMVCGTLSAPGVTLGKCTWGNVGGITPNNVVGAEVLKSGQASYYHTSSSVGDTTTSSFSSKMDAWGLVLGKGGAVTISLSATAEMLDTGWNVCVLGESSDFKSPQRAFSNEVGLSDLGAISGNWGFSATDSSLEMTVTCTDVNASGVHAYHVSYVGRAAAREMSASGDGLLWIVIASDQGGTGTVHNMLTYSMMVTRTAKEEIQLPDPDPTAGYTVWYCPGDFADGNAVSATFGKNGSLYLKKATFTRLCHTQKGWSKSSDGTEKAFDFGYRYAVNADLKLYPYWEWDGTYSVTYRPGDDGIGQVETRIKQKAKPMILEGALYSRSGYRQVGWTSGSGILAQSHDLCGIYSRDASITLYPVWAASGCSASTITYQPDAESEGEKIVVANGKTDVVSLLGSLFSKSGCVQTGWKTADGSRQFSLDGTASGTTSLVLSPIWTPLESASSYTITYRPGSSGIGSVKRDVRSSSGTTLLRSAIFTRDGCEQTGWATRENGAAEYALGGIYAKSADITLYPSWKVQERNRTFVVSYLPTADALGGAASSRKAFGASVTLAGKSFERVGFRQTGWSLTEGGDADYELGGTYSANADVTLYPSWTADRSELLRTITYREATGSTYGEIMDTIAASVSSNLRGATYSLDGMRQTGWALCEGGEKVFELGESISIATATTLYPTWGPADSVSTVTYEPGNEGEGESCTVSVGIGRRLTLRGALFTRANYQQTGWALSENGIKAYELGASFLPTGDAKLYPFWLPNAGTQFTAVTFDPGAFGSGFLTTVAKSAGETMSLQGALFERDGYVQSGWSLTDGGDAEFALGEAFARDVSLTLYPTWTAVAAGTLYAISYDLGEADFGTPVRVVKRHGETMNLLGAVFSRTGYVQTGWSTRPGGGKTHDLGAEYSADAALSLYPVWTTEETESIALMCFNPGANGTGFVLTLAKIGDSSVRLPSFSYSRTGYVQDGWALIDGGAKAYDLGETVASVPVQTFYPHWKAIASQANDVWYKSDTNCSFAVGIRDEKAKGGSVAIRGACCFHQKAPAYVQTGWSRRQDGPVDFDFGDVYAEDRNLTLYPHWDRNPACTTYLIQYNPGPHGKGSTVLDSRFGGPIKTLKGALFESTRKGWFQTGWSRQTDGDKDFALLESGPSEASVVLYPYWSYEPGHVTYEVSFDGNEGEGGMTNVIFSCMEKHVLPTNAFVRTGYVFLGWSMQPKGQWKYEDGSVFEQDVSVGGTTVRLYAQWIADGEYEYGCQLDEDRESATICGVKPSPAGDLVVPDRVVIDGVWQAQARYAGIAARAFAGSTMTSVVIPSSVVRLEAYAFTGCSALKTVWLGATNAVINSLAFEGVPTLTRVVPAEIEGYGFIGWQTDDGRIYPDDATVFQLGHDRTGNSFSISPAYVVRPSADASCACCEILFAETAAVYARRQYCLKDTVYRLPSAASTGRRFSGWRCSNGKRYDDGVLVFNLAEPGETVTMTAIWE